MAFVGPLDAFNSKPIQTKTGTSTKPIFTATSTKVTKDSSGKVTGGTTTLYYSATPGNYTPAATTTDGGKTWTYLKDSNGKEILGADAKKSLEQGALKTNTQQQIISATKPGILGVGGLNPEDQKKVAASTGNTATNPDSSTPQIAGTQQDLLNNESVQDGGYRKVYENLRYPIDRDTKQDYILFTMKRYSPKSFDIAAAASASGKIFGDRIPVSKDKEIMGSVSLPIQPNIADSNAVKWGEDPMDSLDALTQGVFTGLVGGNGQQTTENASGIAEQALGPLKSAGVSELAKRATGTNKSLFTRTTGAVFNPNVELLFTGPTLRGFQFNFSLSAREPEEAVVIRKIIRFFKQGMSVKRAASTLFLKAPNTFDIKYFYGKDGKEHPWINKIKECALTNFTVNYTPVGNYATFEDGAMTQYDLGLTFSELDPIFDDDYTDPKLGGDSDKDTQIGY